VSPRRIASGRDHPVLYGLFILLAGLATIRYDNVSFAYRLILKEDDTGSRQTKSAPMHFRTMVQADVPQGRNGKHKLIVTTILRDLDGLKADAAIKVPLAELAESKEKVRSALNRATRKQGRKVATATDATFLYVWNVAE
jgi:hypothetical protein